MTTILKGWRKRIAAAIKRGKFLALDKRSAGRWSYCAVGERRFRETGERSETLLNKNGRITKYEPLRQLGFMFDDAISHNAVKEAEDLLLRIETAPL